MDPARLRLSRRHLLRAGGALGALGLTGCLSSAIVDRTQPTDPAPPPAALPAGGGAPSLTIPTAGGQIERAPLAPAPVVVSSPRRRVAPTFGAVVPLSGPFAFEGIGFRRGAELAVEALNAAATLAPAGVESLDLQFADSRSEPGRAAAATGELIEAGVAALLASGDEPVVGDAVGIARGDVAWVAPSLARVAEQAEAASVPLVVGHANADHVAASGDSAFRLGGSAREVARATLAHLTTLNADARGSLGRIALMHNEQPLTVVLSELLRAGAPSAGLQVVSTVAYRMAQESLAVELGQARQGGAQALVTCHYWSDGRVLAEQVAQAKPGWGAVVGCLSGAFTQPRLVRQIGARAESLYDVNWVLPRSAAWEQLNGALTRQWPGEAFGYHQFLGWASVRLVADAVLRAGSLDGARLRDSLSAASLALDPAPWAGAVRFDRSGQNTAALAPLAQIQGGVPRVVAPAPLAEAPPRLSSPGA